MKHHHGNNHFVGIERHRIEGNEFDEVVGGGANKQRKAKATNNQALPISIGKGSFKHNDCGEENDHEQGCAVDLPKIKKMGMNEPIETRLIPLSQLADVKPANFTDRKRGTGLAGKQLDGR